LLKEELSDWSDGRQQDDEENDESELAKIDYLYDFKSIFANPSQEASYRSPYDTAPVKKATGGLLESKSETAPSDDTGIEIIASILEKRIEEVSEADIDFVVDLIAQQTVLSTPEMQYDDTSNNMVDAGDTGVVNPPSKNNRDTYTDQLLKLLG